MAAILALKDSSVPVATSVVRAHNQDHFEPIGELTKALDDEVQGLVRILPRRLIGHPDGLVIGLRDAWLVDKKINNEVDVVTAGACRRQRPDTPTEPTSRVSASSNPSATADLPVRPSGDAT